jgi:hypothetical protein
MARNLSKRKKPAMSSSAVSRSNGVGQSTRAHARTNKAEKIFVDDMMRISKRALAKMSPAEREERLRKLNEYLSTLDGSVPKHV